MHILSKNAWKEMNKLQHRHYLNVYEKYFSLKFVLTITFLISFWIFYNIEFPLTFQ